MKRLVWLGSWLWNHWPLSLLAGVVGGLTDYLLDVRMHIPYPIVLLICLVLGAACGVSYAVIEEAVRQIRREAQK